MPSHMSTLGLLRSLYVYRFRPGRRTALDRHYRPFVPPGGLVFDVGAHVGDRTDAFSRLGARVVAVEPHPDLSRHLAHRYRRRDRITVVPAALGATAGKDVLYVCRHNPTVSTLSAEWAARAPHVPGWESVRYTDSPFPVTRTTLDTLVEHHGIPDFIKIDVEGSEDEVLAGLSRAVPALSFEFLPPQRDVALYALLRLDVLGTYEYNFSLGEELRLVMPDRWWANSRELLAYLAEIPDNGPSGDIYARLTPTS